MLHSKRKCVGKKFNHAKTSSTVENCNKFSFVDTNDSTLHEELSTDSRVTTRPGPPPPSRKSPIAANAVVTPVHDSIGKTKPDEDILYPHTDIIDLNMHLANGRTENKFWCAKCIIYFGFECDLINHMFVHIKSILASAALRESDRQIELALENKMISEQCVNAVDEREQGYSEVEDDNLADFCKRSEERPKRKKKVKKKSSKKVTSAKTKKTKNTQVKIRKKRVTLLERMTRVFKCDHCPYQARERWMLSKHIIIHGDYKPFACEKCSYTCIRKNMLTKHYTTHSDDRLYSCSECHLKYKYSSDLRRHEKLHQDKNYTCEICGKKFFRADSLFNHRRTHSDERPFVCALCPYTTKDPKVLKIHKLRHEPEKRFKCDQCDFATSSKASFKNHHLTRHSDETIQCEKCPFTCKTPGALKNHSLVHTTEQALTCPQCQQFFKNERALKRHFRVHLTNK